MPEAFFGLANALFWLGDLAGTIASCEKAYAGFRRRGDAMFAAGAALSLVGYNKGYPAMRPQPADGCHGRHGSSRTRFPNSAGSSWGPPRMSRTTRSEARRWRGKRPRSGGRTATPTWS